MADHQEAPGAGESAGRIRVAFALNAAFTILEVVGGLMTNSVAILSDAVHDLGDTLSLGLAWWLQRYATRPGGELYSFGYRRLSLVGALVTTTTLVIGAVAVLSRALPRLLAPEAPDARGMIAFAVVGVAVNGVAAWRLHGGRNMNERMVSWHLLEDVLGWVAVLVAALVMAVRDVPILDPLLSIGITLFVLRNVVAGLRRILRIFLQAAPEELAPPRVEAVLAALPDVHSVHHTHVWSLDGDSHVLTTHLVVDDGMAAGDIARVRARIKSELRKLDIHHATVEIETEAEGCVDTCHLTLDG